MKIQPFQLASVIVTMTKILLQMYQKVWKKKIQALTPQAARSLYNQAKHLLWAKNKVIIVRRKKLVKSE